MKADAFSRRAPPVDRGLRMNSKEIRKDVQEFQASVAKLGGEIKNASSLWKDSKYTELSSSVSTVSNQAKELMVTGDRCCASIDKFDRIASEKY